MLCWLNRSNLNFTWFVQSVSCSLFANNTVAGGQFAWAVGLIKLFTIFNNKTFRSIVQTVAIEIGGAVTLFTTLFHVYS